MSLPPRRGTVKGAGASAAVRGGEIGRSVAETAAGAAPPALRGGSGPELGRRHRPPPPRPPQGHRVGGGRGGAAPPLPGRRDGAGAPRRGAGAAAGGGRHKGAPGGVPAEGPGGVGGPVLRPAGGGEAAGGRGTARRAHRSSGRCGSRPPRTRRRWAAWAKRRGRSAESRPCEGELAFLENAGPVELEAEQALALPALQALARKPAVRLPARGTEHQPFSPRTRWAARVPATGAGRTREADWTPRPRRWRCRRF